MTLFVRKTESLAHVNLLLRGGISGGLDLRKIGAGIFGLDGKTLKFNSAAETVTFAAGGSQQVPLTMNDILTQIAAALTARQTRMIDGNLGFIDVDFSDAVILDADSTAAVLLGFDDGVITGKLYNAPGGAAPALVSISAGLASDATFLMVTDE